MKRRCRGLMAWEDAAMLVRGIMPPFVVVDPLLGGAAAVVGAASVAFVSFEGADLEVVALLLKRYICPRLGQTCLCVLGVDGGSAG